MLNTGGIWYSEVDWGGGGPGLNDMIWLLLADGTKAWTDWTGLSTNRLTSCGKQRINCSDTQKRKPPEVCRLCLHSRIYCLSFTFWRFIQAAAGCCRYPQAYPILQAYVGLCRQMQAFHISPGRAGSPLAQAFRIEAGPLKNTELVCQIQGQECFDLAWCCFFLFDSYCIHSN